MLRKRKREEPEDDSKQEGKGRDQLAHSRSNGRRTVAYTSEHTVLHNSNPTYIYDQNGNTL